MQFDATSKQWMRCNRHLSGFTTLFPNKTKTYQRKHWHLYVFNLLYRIVRVIATTDFCWCPRCRSLGTVVPSAVSYHVQAIIARPLCTFLLARLLVSFSAHPRHVGENAGSRKREERRKELLRRNARSPLVLVLREELDWIYRMLVTVSAG